MSNAIKNGFIYIFTLFFNQLIPFITLPIFTRILTPVEYGHLALVQIFSTITSAFSHLGLAAAFDRNYFEYKKLGLEKSLLFTIILFSLITSSVMGVVVYCTKGFVAEEIFRTRKIEDLLLLGFLVGTLSLIKSYFLNYLKNSEMAPNYFKLFTTENIISNVVGLVLIVFYKTGISGILWGQLSANLFVSILSFILLIYKSSPKVFIKGLWESLKISLPLIPRIFIGVINTEFDKYMLNILNSIGGVGIYSIGQKIGYAVFNYMGAIQNVWSPKVFKKMFEMESIKGGREIGKLLTPYAYFSVGLAVMCVLFCEELLIIMVPKSYYQAIDVIVILSVFYSTLFFGKQTQLLYAKRTKTISFLSFFDVGVNIIFNIICIKLWGVIGAALATLFTGLVGGTISFIFSQRAYKIYWEYRKLLIIYGLLIFYAVSVLILRHVVDFYLIKALCKILFISFFVFVGFYYKIIRKDSLYEIKDNLLARFSKRSSMTTQES